MKQPFWKRLLSYLAEIHIESAPSTLNPHLYVSLSKGRYQLCSANAVYSFEDLYTNFFTTFQNLRWEKTRIETVLILGFGLGSIPLILEREFGKSFIYTGVEKDANVLYLAKKYILDELKSPLEFHIADAATFIQSTDRRFDMICMDVFVDDKIPEHLKSMAFLNALNTILSPGGILLFNTLYRTKTDRDASNQFYQEHFLTVFPSAGYLRVQGNMILCQERSFFHDPVKT